MPIPRLSFVGRLVPTFVLLLVLPASAQTPWVELPNAPFAGRHNDAYFVDADNGWIVNGDGEIFHTADGGQSFDLQLSSPNTHFRSVGFVNPLRGFAGNVGDGEFGTTDASALYHTMDGGEQWAPQSGWHGFTPKGLCGMNVVNDSVVVAVGRVRGPAYFVRTTNAGRTWTSKRMDTYAAGLIDVHFFTPDSGFAVGLTSVEHENSRGIVLFTADGGETWEQRFVTSRTGEWAWKVMFPSRDVGYVSLQRNAETPIYFLKTSDGGVTWDEKLFSESYYFVQGIGFVDELTGWIGGYSQEPTYVTFDGGDTWASADFGSRINRFRFLSDSLGYAVGQRVYKYDLRTPTFVDELIAEDGGLHLKPNYPNPFSASTTLRYATSEPGPARVVVYDVLGREVARPVDRVVAAGEHEQSLSAAGLADGVYVVKLERGVRSVSRLVTVAR